MQVLGAFCRCLKMASCDAMQARLHVKVDLQAAFSCVLRTSQLHGPSFSSFSDAVNFLKKEGLSGAAKQAMDSLSATIEQAKSVPSYLNEQANFLLQKVSVAWEKLSSVPAGACGAFCKYFPLKSSSMEHITCFAALGCISAAVS